MASNMITTLFLLLLRTWLAEAQNPGYGGGGTTQPEPKVPGGGPPQTMPGGRVAPADPKNPNANLPGNEVAKTYLTDDYYRQTCPQAEKIVGDAVAAALAIDKDIPPALIRLHAHDCLVQGCEGSILLDPTPLNPQTEKEAPLNKNSVRGMEVIDQAKAQLEKECPGIVSCADIMAFAARDSVYRLGSPYFEVPGGRRDGRGSNARDTVELPVTGQTVKQITDIFAMKDLNQEEMVALLGAHTVGIAHCSTFQDRLNVITPGRERTMDPTLAKQLTKLCPMTKNFDAFVNGATAPLDVITPDVWDNAFYKGLLENKGILRSDIALLHDANTSALVKEYSVNQDKWFESFSRAFVKMGSAGVLTGTQGEIRRQCRFVN